MKAKKLLLWDAVTAKNDGYMNAFCPHRVKWSDVSTNFNDFVPHAQKFLSVNFFLKYDFNKLGVKLPQNVTWNDE